MDSEFPKYFLELRFNPKNSESANRKIENLKKKIEIISILKGDNYICFIIVSPLSKGILVKMREDSDFYFIIQYKL